MDLGALNSNPSISVYRSQADTLKSLDTFSCSVLSSCSTSTHNNLFTGVMFQNETYVPVEESTKGRVSLKHFLTQVITEIELEFPFSFLKCETESRKALHNLEALDVFTTQWELISKA
jgi:hypothetical protein